MNANEVDDEVCASCGIAEVDEIKLKKCAACESVRYCSDKCERDHRQQHEEACKKREVELREQILFRQPESSCFGDCPICFLPFPLDPIKRAVMGCCSKVICNGCFYANALRNGWKRTCPFCRHPIPKSQAELDLNYMKRAEKNDLAAMTQMGHRRYDEGDYSSAFKYYTKAAALGYMDAHAKLADLYYEGEGVEKAEKKALHHWEEAAIGGHAGARHNLAVIEPDTEKAVKHLIIAANLGDEDSMKELWKFYAEGYVKKDVLTATLRSHHDAVEATKSPQRKVFEEVWDG